jgi:hypothetical protein
MPEAQFADRPAKAGVGPAPELAREIWLLSGGAISLMLVHGDRAYAAAAHAAKRLLHGKISSGPALRAGRSRTGA